MDRHPVGEDQEALLDVEDVDLGPSGRVVADTAHLQRDPERHPLVGREGDAGHEPPAGKIRLARAGVLEPHRTGPAGRRGKGATPWPTSACCGDRIETASMVTASGPLFAMLGITLNAPDCWGT